MEQKITIPIKSHDTALLFKIRISNKRDLFNSAIFKTALLYKLAKRQHPYAFVKLLEITEGVTTFLNDIDKTIIALEKAVVLKQSAIIELPTLQTIRLGFSNPLIYQLIEAIIKFDKLMVLLMTARNLSIYADKSTFFTIKSRDRQRLFTLLSSIIQIKTRNLPIVTLEDYVAHSESYQQLEKQGFGDITFDKLIQALNISTTPNVAINIVNKQMVNNKDKILRENFLH